MARAEETAELIVAKPPLATRMMKEFVIRFGDTPTDEAWRVQTLMNTLLTQLTTDGDEGRLAFQEKRKPNFTGGLRRKGEAFEKLTAEQRERIDYLKRTGGAG
jgi:enoyl-CoA hydratase/E-phenylitaconyl-CoA hydratase/naphthyl-2-hydroxymethylsuccinyl-CoA hydratase